MFELEDNEVCLCDSNRKYKNCCKKRGIQWLHDGKGNAIRKFSLGEELMENFESLKERFT
uniref:SEC-C metal-binding domain-containing protein n=1 Tax=Saccharibacillus sp. CPCC 101409 TaxID=3058041 RepID=UPI0034A01C91